MSRSSSCIWKTCKRPPWKEGLCKPCFIERHELTPVVLEHLDWIHACKEEPVLSELFKRAVNAKAEELSEVMTRQVVARLYPGKQVNILHVLRSPRENVYAPEAVIDGCVHEIKNTVILTPRLAMYAAVRLQRLLLRVQRVEVKAKAEDGGRCARRERRTAM